MPPTTGTPSLEDSFTILADRERRRILLALYRSGTGRVRREELAPAEGRESWEVAFHHRHRPRLESAELLTVSDDRSVLGRGDRFETVVPLLAAIEASDPPRDHCCDQNRIPRADD